jgi:hypothetical protein
MLSGPEFELQHRTNSSIEHGLPRISGDHVIEVEGNYHIHLGFKESAEVILLKPAHFEISGYKGKFRGYGIREIIEASSIGFTGHQCDAKLVTSADKVRLYYEKQASLFSKLADSGTGNVPGLRKLAELMSEEASKLGK